MATTYRWIIRTNDFKSRGMMLPSGKVEGRRSKVRDVAVYGAFARALETQCPQDGEASATLEVVTNGYRTELARYSGRVTEWVKGNGRGEAHCMYPKRGEWMLEEDHASIDGVAQDRIVTK